MERKTWFVEILLPLPVPGTFTYRVPHELAGEIKLGMRAVVQFGKKKIYTGLIREIHERVPEYRSVKYILSVLDHEPIVTPSQYHFWNWLASYYLCHEGEVMNTALPSSLKLASESRIILNPNFNQNYSNLNEKEYLVAEALETQESLTLSEVSKLVEQVKVVPLIKTLIDKEVVQVKEELVDEYKPRKETFVKLAGDYYDEDALSQMFDELNKRAYKQLEVLMMYLNLSRKNEESDEISRSKLLQESNASASVLKSLVDKGILEQFEKTVSRLKEYKTTHPVDSIEFSEEQLFGLQSIREQLNEKQVVLLHGVTSSGKTEIYIKLIDEAIRKGQQVLYLLPEIALTAQIINRVKKFFGPLTGVYHSRYSRDEKVEIWKRVIAGQTTKGNGYKLVLGARSALMLPFNNLGLIIVDEEHDNSYKQFDPAPRYHARDAAIYLAQLHNTKVVLGSATPAIESYYNARTGRYGLVELHKRYGNIQMPEIEVVDIKSATRRKEMKSHFSNRMLELIGASLENKEQVILFQNRRGFSLRLECQTCHYMPQCQNCDVTLIYHKKHNRLRCHYCGFSTSIPEKCPECGSADIKMKGFGTEKIEEELAMYFPDAIISRMDLDTTRRKNAYQRIISDFENRRIDILTGTQMVTKGLDFDNVSLVGVMNADNMLSFPDFRSFERSFQLMAQVSGRAGRKNKRGRVLIQTYNPHHSVIRNVIDNDYESMYKSQILERKNYKYPPFYRLSRITLKHKDAHKLNEASKELAYRLKQAFGKRVLGPEFPLVSRIRNLYLENIIVKFERSREHQQMKEKMAEIIRKFNNEPDYKPIRVAIDVDPQ
ncbi:MAG: primosomal protein N' [Bacteroidales bacterium]|nr:primosomal protein N' [Bacteroidales bacterium]